MEPVPLRNCMDQLKSLEYSPILGNNLVNQGSKIQSQIPSFNHPGRQRNSSTSSITKATSPLTRKRLFSQTTPPEDVKGDSKLLKMDQKQLDESLSRFLNEMRQENQKQNDKNSENLNKTLKDHLTNTEKIISDKFSLLTGQISEIKVKQATETAERESLKNTVDNLQKQVNSLQQKLNEVESNATSSLEGNTEGIVEALLPLVQDTLAEKIDYNTAEVKAFNNQAKANYYQSLVNDIKSVEKDVMLYGFKPTNRANLQEEIESVLFADIMELEGLSCEAVAIGVAREDRPQAVRLSFETVEARNTLLGRAFKLPRRISLEKCMPRRYRNKNKEFKRYAWQLKQVDTDLVTRIVFRGHKLILEMKQKDAGDSKFDWTIVKEYFPEPESPTPKSDRSQIRTGLMPSKTIEMVGKNYVFLSDLTALEDDSKTLSYFKEVYLNKEDLDSIMEIDSDNMMTKRFLKIKLNDRKSCLDFKNKYEKAPFNGKSPRISVFLENE